MDTSERYCEECGAANTREARCCFACARPLESVAPEQALAISSSTPATKLPSSHALPDPFLSASEYVQITLKTNMQTTVQLVPSQSQALTPLLHGRYRVLGQVGTGGFGAVYKARDLQAHGRMVAIKAIELDTLSASQAIEATDTFNRELSLLSNLDHPHLPNIYEHFIDETHWYLVMDFIDGEPLDDYLQQMQLTCLPLKQVINIGLQLCDVLRYLHQLKPPVIFRDLKPANIMLTPGGRLYLIDFGIARRFKPGQLKDTTPLGSPGFASPEQYGKAQTTPRSDIYSLGATLYFLLTGYDPANTPFHLPPIESLCPHLPEPLSKLITSMLALDPTQRPVNIMAVQHILSDYGSSTRHTTVLAQPQASSPPSLPVASPPRRLKNFLKGLVSVALTCMVLAACTLTAHFMGSLSMAATDEPTYNGPLRISQMPTLFRMPYIGHIQALNPFTSSDPQDAELENLLFGRLVGLSRDGLTVQTSIASSWDVDAEGLNWTFHLNPDASFSNGALITAQDVATSLNYALASSAAASSCPFFGLIKDADQLAAHQRSTLIGDSIVVLDPATLALTTTRPAPYLLATLAAPCGSILQQNDLKTLGARSPANFTQLAFSGSYILTNYAQDSEFATLSLSALHEDSEHNSFMPVQINVQSYPDTEASYAAYLGGKVDISPLSSQEYLSNPQNASISYAHPLTLHYYAMNYLARPFDNIAIRQAFALGLDRDLLASSSHSTPTNSLLDTWSSATYESAADDNPTVAKELFQQGLKAEDASSPAQLAPIVFTYQAGQPELASEVARAQQMWQELFGVKITLRASNDLTQAIAATRGNASLQLWAADYTPAYLDPYAQVGLPFAAGSPLNTVNYGQNTSSHAAQQQALQRSLATATLQSMNDVQRLQFYQNADQQLTSDVAWLPIYMVARPYIVNSAFTNSLENQWSAWGAANECVFLPPC